MAAFVTGNDDNNDSKQSTSTNVKPQKSDIQIAADVLLRELCEAISVSELGSILPYSICQKIAEYGRIFIDSVILTEEEQLYMTEMIESQSQTQHLKNCEWNLLYSGSTDGDTQDSFHSNCDGYASTGVG